MDKKKGAIKNISKVDRYFDSQTETRRGPELMDRLVRQAEAYQLVLDRISAISPDISLEAVEQEFNGLFEDILNRTPQEIQDIFQQVETMKSLPPSEDVWEKKRKLIDMYPELDSLLRIQGTLSRKKDTFRMLRRYEGDWSGRMHRRINMELTKRNLRPSDIESIAVNSFDVVVTMSGLLNKSSKQFVDVERGGFSVVGKPFIFISNLGEDFIREAISHERTHQLLGQAGLEAQSNMSGVLDASIKDFDQHKDGSPEEVKNYERQISNLVPARFLDANHEEFIAELRNAEEKGFIDEELFEQYRHLPKWSDEDARIYATKAVFSSAGEDIFQAIVIASKGVRREDFPAHVREQLNELRLGLRSAFLEVVDQMRSALSLARRLGSDAEEFTHLLFVTFPPSKYRHVEKVLRYKYASL